MIQVFAFVILLGTSLRPAPAEELAGTVFPLPSSTYAASRIVAGPDGNLWFNDVYQVGRLTPTGEVQRFPVPLEGIQEHQNAVGEIIVGPDRTLWFVQPYAARIGRIDTDGMFHPFISTLPDPVGIALAKDGNVWISHRGTGQLTRIGHEGAVETFALPLKGHAEALCAGPDGHIWATFVPESGRYALVRIEADGTMTPYPVALILEVNSVITAGTDGNLWFAGSLSGYVGRLTPAGELTQFPFPTREGPIPLPQRYTPQAMIAGPDGNVWFTDGEYRSGRLVRVTPDGRTDIFTLPVLEVSGLITGPDGNLWVGSGDKILRVVPPPTPTPVIPPAEVPPRAYVAGLFFSRLSIIEMESDSILRQRRYRRHRTWPVETVPVTDAGLNLYDIEITPDGREAYMVSAGMVQVLDTRGNWPIRTFALPVIEVSIAPNGHFAYLAVAAEDGGILVFDTLEKEVTGFIPLDCPARTTFSPTGEMAYVTSWKRLCRDGDYDDELFVVNAVTATLEATIPLKEPRGIAISQDGTFAFVGATFDELRLGDAGFVVIDLHTNEVTEKHRLPGSDDVGVIIFTDDDKVAYVTYRESLLRMDVASREIIDAVDLDPIFGPAFAKLTPDGKRIYVIDYPYFVRVLDTATRQLVKRIEVDYEPVAIAFAIQSTPHPTWTPTATRTPHPTPTLRQCVGDCSGDGQVSVNEIVAGIRIALGDARLEICADFDMNGDGNTSVGELVAAVSSALGGCVH